MSVAQRLRQPGCLLLDGGFATRLETLGVTLDVQLWSASVLSTSPELIARVHRDYLEAGAQVIISASYQASVEGFVAAGYEAEEARRLIDLSVKIARDERDRFAGSRQDSPVALSPLVAASVGPFGAFLANGSEYTGEYGVSRQRLHDFHADRLDLLLDAGPDLLAIETIPSTMEAEVLAELLGERPEAEAWMSFSCGDGTSLCDGSSLAAAASVVARTPNVVAIGANCVAPGMTKSLVETLGTASSKPIVLYPNSGESYDAVTQSWYGERDPVDFARLALEWQAAGVKILGGCCRTEPAHIREMANVLRRA